MYLCVVKENRKYSAANPKRPRKYKVVNMVNEDDHKAIERYLGRYKISNKSRRFRETINSHILKNLEEDYPTLFNENEMRR